MGYQSRKRNYRSRRERLQGHQRIGRVVFIFLLIGLALYLFFTRHAWWSYLETYFY